MAITKEKARQIASNWHGGQWSGLYQFSSSGIYVSENHDRYIREVERDLNLAKLKKDKEDLRKLKNYFILRKAKK